MQNIFHSGGLGKLVEFLKNVDVVYVISCTRFSSVNQVYGFAKLYHERGVTVHFVAEPYLDIGNGKQWRPAVANAIRGMVESEYNGDVEIKTVQKMFVPLSKCKFGMFGLDSSASKGWNYVNLGMGNQEILSKNRK